MNKFHQQGATLIAECWVPKIHLNQLNELLELRNLDQSDSNVTKLLKAELQVLTQNLDEREKMQMDPPT
eukprot:CAMPEP_0116963902 /NCGR_PEP_ID=MMETSP0467-20121206/48219_1 /TAXON_ID=283647 /ORGANISM="Mesodinium pulex, Strain SPMC105" /LENGTH=68 /DNA_ID=CAMNT_0004652683 /DNA_START=957 /DNA_END=1163 /DNA_ORIENTATION=+